MSQHLGWISKIPPLTTEAAITSVAAQIDRTGEVPAKISTTVALDFGCITIDESLKLYLFGTPGQDRFGFMWHDLSQGALGALVIVDARRVNDCYPAVDYFEKLHLPFVVAVNLFDGELSHDLTELRWALAIDAGIPLITFDARNRISVRDALLAVLRHTRSRIEGAWQTGRATRRLAWPCPVSVYLPPHSCGKPGIFWQPHEEKNSGGMPGVIHWSRLSSVMMGCGSIHSLGTGLPDRIQVAATTAVRHWYTG